MPGSTHDNLIITTMCPCMLYIANCGIPEIPFTPDNESAPVVVDYVDDNSVSAYIEGSTVSFSCLPGLEVIGPNSATCTENGEWVPEPTGIMCNNMSLEGECTIMHKSLPSPDLRGLIINFVDNNIIIAARA